MAPVKSSAGGSIRAETIDYLMACWQVMQDGAMNGVVAFDGLLDAERLRDAIRLTLDTEPILGCRFTERWYRPIWRRRADLDRLELCRLERTDATSPALERFFAEPLDPERDCQVRVGLLRGPTDTMAIKFSHLAGDGQALKLYLLRLADAYNGLAADTGYRPAPNANLDRSLRRVVPRALAERERRAEVSSRNGARKLGHWTPPAMNETTPTPHLHVRRLGARRYSEVFHYACRHRATVLNVLLGALFLATRDVVPHTADAMLPLWSIVDLRRYVTDQNTMPLCNLFGLIRVQVDADEADLDELVEQVRGQLLADRGRLGLTTPPVILETGPVVRRVLRCVPYGLLKGALQARLARAKFGIPLLTDVGAMPDPLDFGGLGVTDSYMTTGTIHNPAALIFCVSSFRNDLTITSNTSHGFAVERLLDGMLAVLPGEAEEGLPSR